MPLHATSLSRKFETRWLNRRVLPAVKPESDGQHVVGFSLLVHYGFRLCVSIFYYAWFKVVIDIVLVCALMNAAREMAVQSRYSPSKSPRRA